MTAYGIRRATQADLEFVAEHMRAADTAEVAALGFSPLDALALSLTSSREAWTGLVGDEPICVFGVSPLSLLSDTGVPWLLGTDGVPRNARAFLSIGKRIVAEWRKEWSRLHNVVDGRYTEAMRWLEWLGFHVQRDVSILAGPEAVVFHPFSMER